jgi:spermidine dehydrogenase
MRRIRRRDFLNGMAMAVGGAAFAPPAWLLALEDDPEKAAGYYPPARTGLRGTHEGAYEVGHEVRDGRFLGAALPAPDEEYDLIVVGAGISGLTAAYLFRKLAGATGRVLVLDNHDDFGGHAKRNEFSVGSRTLLGYGGTFSIDSPSPYSGEAKGLISELGIEVEDWARALDARLYPGLGLRPATFFDRETFGADRLVPGDEPWEDASAPLSETARRDLRRLHKERPDPYPGLTAAEKKARLARVSYADYLTGVLGLDTSVLPLLQARPHGLYGVGIDAVPAQDAWGLGFPGFDGLGLDPEPGPGMNHDAIRNAEAERYFFHFPDGNASIARLLVRSLIPAALPGSTTADLVTARADYARLDDPSSPTRIRLNSTAVRVKPGADRANDPVDVAYVRGGRLRVARGGRCVLACWSTIVPYLVPELPERQKAALSYAVKVPIVYTNVVLRDWKAFRKLGVHSVRAPGGYHSTFNLDLPVTVGAYRPSATPEEAVLVHMMRTPCRPGLPAREQHRAGRLELLTTPFATFEREIRAQLARALGAGGFDAARDIQAITVNRWPHGYAYQYNSLWDPFWLDGGEEPCHVARQPFGRIAIANADTAAYAYTDAAIDQAFRAVREVLA